MGGDPVNVVDPFGLDQYVIRYLRCTGDAHPLDEDAPTLDVGRCWWVYNVWDFEGMSPYFEGYGTDYLLAQAGFPRAQILRPYCPSRPVDDRVSAGARAASAGNLAHGAIGSGLQAIANSTGSPSSARAIGRAWLPLSLSLTLADAGLAGAASAQRGEPLDVVIARTILPPAGAAAGGTVGAGVGSLAGPVGSFGLGTAGALGGAEGGQRLASGYARARGCE